MSSIRLTQNYFVIISVLLLYSCAQVVSPTGGPKDVVPPKLIKATPESKSLHFSAKSIVLEFNEYITLRDVQGQLTVSPPLKYPPIVKEKNKSIKIELKDTLMENTTYSFNFGKAIVDLTEANVLEDFRYIFSTGSFLDSSYVFGRVDYAENHKTEKGIIIMLYDEKKYTSDSFAYKQIPSYFGKTNGSGGFQINNIKQGKYKVIALKDANNNYVYDAPDEFIGFFDSIYSLDSNAYISLSQFQQINPKFFVKKANSVQYGEIRIEFNKPAGDLKIEALNAQFKKAWYIEEYSKNRDSLSLWLTDVIADTLKLIVTNDKKVIDTLEVAIAKKPEQNNVQSGGRGKGASFNLIASTNCAKEIPPNQSVILTLNHPIKEYDASKIILKQGSQMQKCTLNIMDKASRKFKITGFNLLPDSAYSLLVTPGSFIDIFGLLNDTAKAVFKVQKEDDFGKLKLKINVASTNINYIVQLLDEKGNVFREEKINSSKLCVFETLKPLTYNVKVIVDENKNDKWDTGDFSKKLQPEKTMYSPKNYSIRAGWDMEEEWSL